METTQTRETAQTLSSSKKGRRSADERWAAIQRTQKKMAPPAGAEDIGVLVARSMAAYWSRREQEVRGKTGTIERQAAEATRLAAFRIQRSADLWRSGLRGFLSSLTLILTFRKLRSLLKARKAERKEAKAGAAPAA